MTGREPEFAEIVANYPFASRFRLLPVTLAENVRSAGWVTIFRRTGSSKRPLSPIGQSVFGNGTAYAVIQTVGHLAESG